MWLSQSNHDERIKHVRTVQRRVYTGAQLPRGARVEGPGDQAGAGHGQEIGGASCERQGDVGKERIKRQEDVEGKVD